MKTYQSLRIIFVLFICTLLFTLNVKSQDLIFLTNDTIKCKIIKDHVQFLEYTLENDTSIHRIYQNQYDSYFQHTAIKTTQNNNTQNNNIQYNSNNIASPKKNKQSPPSPETDYPITTLGIGIGLDYGGIIGGRLTLLAIPNISFFLGFGYNLADAGINIGAFVRLAPKSKICPILGGMYGYNSVLLITGSTKYINKSYYGPSINIGLEFRSKKLRNYISTSVIIPFRSKSFENDLNTLRNDPSIVITNEPSEALFSIGYHIVF